MGKRAILYLRRKYRRSVLLFLLLFIISFSLAVGVTVWNSIGAVTHEIQQQLGTSFVLKMPALDPENTEYYRPVTLQDGSMTKAYMGATLDQRLVEEIMRVDGVSAYNGEQAQWVHVDDMEVYPGAMTLRIEEALADPGRMRSIENNFDIVGGFAFYQTEGQETVVYSNTDTSLYEKFRTGAFELVSGRHITAADKQKVLISDEVAERNGFAVGDTFHISLWNKHLGEYDSFDKVLQVWELEIVGIFHVNGYQPTGIWVHEDKIAYNWLLTDDQTVTQIKKVWNESRYRDDVSNYGYDNLTFFVEDPARLTAIVEEVKRLEDPAVSFFPISLDDTMYKSTVDPLNSIRNLVAGLVGAITVGCTIVLLIVFTMWVRSRRQEVAIYLSLGIGKVKILGQFVLEAVIVAALALDVALPVSAPVTDEIGNQMLASTMEAAQPQEEQYTEEDILQAARNGQVAELFTYDSGSYAGPESIDFSFGLIQLLVLVGLELLIILASICKGGSFIFKLQPRQILTTLR